MSLNKVFKISPDDINSKVSMITSLSKVFKIWPDDIYSRVGDTQCSYSFTFGYVHFIHVVATK